MDEVHRQLKAVNGHQIPTRFNDVTETIGNNGETYVTVNGVTYQLVDEPNQSNTSQANGASVASAFNPGPSLQQLDPMQFPFHPNDVHMSNLQTSAGVTHGGGIVNGGGAHFTSDFGHMATPAGTSGGQFVNSMNANSEAIPHVYSPNGCLNSPLALSMKGSDVGHSSSPPTIQVGGQDYILQPGQDLPPEFQEMVSKGLPIDFSNYELVVQDGNEDSSHYDGVNSAENLSVIHGNTVAQDGRCAFNSMYSGDVHQDNILTQPVGAYCGIETSAHDVLQTFSWSSVLGRSSACNYSTVPIGHPRVIACVPGEYDDGEFAFLATDENESPNIDQTKEELPVSGYCRNYIEFLNGNQIETLSSVANSLITNRPTLPKYIPEALKYPPAEATSNTSISSQKSAVQEPPKRSQEQPKRGSNRGRPPSNSIDTKSAKNSTKVPSSSAQNSTRGSTERAPRGRGRGKQKGSGHGTSGDACNGAMVLPDMPLMEPTLVHMMPIEPHFFQKGDFVVERKDAYKQEFPIWRIENGRLLQKFDPFYQEDQMLHKSASVYSSWSGEIRINFKAILVETLSTAGAINGRKPEIVVRLHERFTVKPHDISLEQHPLMEVFNIYMQTILSQALDPSFMLALLHQPEEYYDGPVRQVDQLLHQAKLAMLAEISWTDEFKAALEEYSAYILIALDDNTSINCQAQKDNSGVEAVRALKLYGQIYNRDMMEVTQDITLISAREFMIGKPSIEYIVIYHTLHHYKFLLYKKCIEEVQYMKQTHTKSDRDILAECLQNRIWIQQLFRELTGLLEKYLIIRAEDEPEDLTQSQVTADCFSQNSVSSDIIDSQSIDQQTNTTEQLFNAAPEQLFNSAPEQLFKSAPEHYIPDHTQFCTTSEVFSPANEQLTNARSFISDNDLFLRTPEHFSSVAAQQQYSTAGHFISATGLSNTNGHFSLDSELVNKVSCHFNSLSSATEPQSCSAGFFSAAAEEQLAAAGHFSLAEQTVNIEQKGRLAEQFNAATEQQNGKAEDFNATMEHLSNRESIITYAASQYNTTTTEQFNKEKDQFNNNVENFISPFEQLNHTGPFAPSASQLNESAQYFIQNDLEMNHSMQQYDSPSCIEMMKSPAEPYDNDESTYCSL